MKKENEIKDSVKCEDCKYYAPIYNFTLFGACLNESTFDVFTSKYDSCPLYERKDRLEVEKYDTDI